MSVFISEYYYKKYYYKNNKTVYNKVTYSLNKSFLKLYLNLLVLLSPKYLICIQICNTLFFYKLVTLLQKK